MSKASTPNVSRRIAMRRIGTGIAVLPVAHVLGCGGVEMVQPTDDGGTSAIDSSVASDGAAIDGSSSSTDAGSADEWASGGTAAMSGEYADPFVDDPTTCALICATTLGPCYAETLDRRNISEGYPGLPVRLALRVLDDACNPVEGAVVDVWHTRNTGLYSGEDASDFCTSGDADARAHRYFRGMQTTDANGRVDFDTCFPGWYASRAIHIHVQVRIGDTEYVTSQLFFDEDVKADIFASHPDYAELGQPDTTNDTDDVLPDTNQEDYLLAWSRQPDGAMLAWKTLVIRSSLSDALCGDTGGGGVPPRP